MFKNTNSEYGSVTKFFHWTVFVLVAFMLAYGYLIEDFPKEYKAPAFNIHKLIGLIILTLMFLRLLWTWFNPRPELPKDVALWQRIAERIVQYSLYIVLLAMPIAGWIGSMAAGHAPYIGDWNIVLPIAQNKNLADVAFSYHNTIAILIMVLASIHILAALYHHFIKKDNILRRIMPRKH